MATYKATELHVARGSRSAIVVLHRYSDRVVISEIDRGHMGSLYSNEPFPSEAAGFEAAQRMWTASLPGQGAAYRFRE